MRELIRKHYLKSFYIITLILSFFLLLFHIIFESVGKYSVSFTQLAPILAVVLLSLILKESSFLLDIKNHLRINKKVTKWLIVVILIPTTLIVLSGLIMSYYKIDYVPWKGDIWFYLLSFLAILIGCVAEELAWRGFLLPKLQKKYSFFISSIIVGIMWGVWHFNFTGGILGFILYTITIIEMSILMTWVYNKTNGNLILMSLWHLTFNLASHIFLWERFLLKLFIIQSVVFGFFCLIVLIFDRKTMFNNHISNNIDKSL